MMSSYGMMLDRLHEGLVEEILLRLPIKSILLYRCVCKSWRSLITTPNFISRHLLLRHSSSGSSENPQKIFVTRYDHITNRKLFLFNNQFEGYFLPPMSLHLPPSLQNEKSTLLKIIGSVKGLICISLSDVCQASFYHLILFNPSIGRFQSIPPPPPPPPYYSPKPWSVQGFGFDETTQDYRILLILKGEGGGFVYSLNSNSWRSLPISPPPPGHFNSCLAVFVNGAIHWINNNCIIVFDLKDETFRQIPLPESFVERRGHSLHLMEFGGEDSFSSSSLALGVPNSEGETHIWVMKEYGLVEESSSSWIKLATVLDSSSDLLGFRNNDQVLVRCRVRYGIRRTGCIVSQSIHNSSEVQNLMDLGGDREHSSFGFVYKYVPSLVLFDKHNNVDATFVIEEEGEPI